MTYNNNNNNNNNNGQGFDTFIISGDITATSSRMNDKYGSTTKSLYFTPKDEDERNKLKDIGLQEYTSQDGENFFILKFTRVSYLYTEGDDEAIEDFSEWGGLDTPNFSFSDVKIAVMKLFSEEYRTEFFRVQAILQSGMSVFNTFKPINPFL